MARLLIKLDAVDAVRSPAPPIWQERGFKKWWERVDAALGIREWSDLPDDLLERRMVAVTEKEPTGDVLDRKGLIEAFSCHTVEVIG